MFSSRGLPKKKTTKFGSVSLADRKKLYKDCWKFRAVIKVLIEKAIINFILKDLQLCLLNMIVHSLKGKSLEKTILH